MKMNKKPLKQIMNKLKILSLSVLLGVSAYATAQTDTTVQTKSFSLKEAIDYALTHNALNMNSEIDVQMSNAKKNEIRGMGMPQISGSFDLKDYVELPTQLLPGEVFGGPPGTFIPVQFGTKYNATIGAQATLGIFNSDYIVALQSSKTFLELSKKNAQRSKIETTVAVSKAYYSVLVNRQRLQLLETNIQRIKKLFDDTKALNQSGFVEKIDVDRVEVALNNLIAEKEKVARLIMIAEYLLKFQMGLDVLTPIVLTDSMNFDEIPQMPDTAIAGKFDFKNRIEYSLLLNQRKLNELDWKRNRMGYLPTLFVYGNLSSQAQRNEFDIFNTSKRWYPIGIIGLTLNVPIFDGLQKNYRIQQSKLSLMKTQNMISFTENSIKLEISSTLVVYQNAIQSLATQKKNMMLAQGVYDASKKKYDAGVGSNLEVMTAETSLKEAQTNYYNALFEYYVAKVDLDKATGSIK